MGRYNYLVESLEERNQGFLDALCEDIGKLQSCEFDDSQIKKMLGTMSYVKIWCNQPQWLLPIKKLPKGYKWTDGEKFRQKNKEESHTYYFLEIGQDLYVKGMGIAGEKYGQCTNVRIPNWKNVPFREVDMFTQNTYIRDCFLKYWHGHGLDVGFLEKITRDCETSDG